MTATLRPLLLVLLCGGVSACGGLTGGPQGPQPLTPTQQFSARVERTPEELAILPSPQGLSPQQADALRQFAARWRDRSGDPVVVRLPTDGDRQLTEAAAHASIGALAANGVDPSMVRIEGYDPPRSRGPAPILIGYTAYTAVGPECAETWTQVDATFSSRTSGNFGCSTVANLAAMVANPRDLVEPRPETPADSMRRQIQMALYRSGQSTGATRTADERTQISDAVR